MRIAVVSPFLDRTHGTERCLIEQLENFPLLPDTEIHIYAQRVQDLRGVTPYKFSQATHPDAHLFWHHVPAIPGPHLLQFGFWFFANRVCRWWDAKHRGLKFDLVYSPGINASDADAVAVHIIFTEFYRGLLGQLSFLKNPVSHWPRLLHRRLYYRLIMALEKKIYRRTQVSLAAVSTSLAHQLQRSFQRQSVRVIHNGVDADSLSPSRRLAVRSVARQHLALSPGEFVFLLIANDFKNKGLDALLCALHKLPEFQWRLLVVGRDERSLYDRLIREYGIIHRVNFLAPSSDVLQFYAAVDAYVGPSLQDSFGMPVLEAMSCGLPVVCSSRAGVSEIVTNGVDGIILRDPQDAEEIAVSLRSLFVDPKLARQLGEQAHLTAQKHTWNRNAQVTWEWLKELACKKKDSHAAHSKSRPVSQNTPSGTNTPPKLRHPRRPLPALTGVRFFAAFHVVLGHSLPWLDRHFNLPLPFRIFLSHGYLAVALFFLLSGFILAYTYEDQIVTARNRIHFFEARFARIYPVYLLSLILAYPFERGLDTWARVAVLGMVQTWNPCALSLVGAWNYPAWTLSVEAFFYLCFPFVLPWLSRQSNGTLRSMGVVLLGFSVLAQTPLRGLGGISGGLIPLPIWRFPEFLLGIILGLLFLRVPIARQAPSRSIMTFVAVAGVFVILSLPLGPWVSIVMIPYASLISRLAYAKDLWVKFLSTRLMLLLGGASYSIYLMQFPVRSWTRTIFDRLPQSVRFLGSPLTPLILILFSVLVFRFWEEPARRMLRRRSLV